jgi:GT2 family glycosyltransferase
MGVDIAITTYRNTEKLKTCLATILEKTKFVDYKIYLFANDPSEEMKKTIHDAMYIDDILFNDHIEPIFNDDNSGSFSSNNNAAAKEGKNDYILFLNDDVYPLRDDWLYSMVSVLDNNNKIGVVGSLLLYPDQKTIQHCGVFFSSKTNNLPYHMFYKQTIDSVSDFISHYRYYQAITGACMLVRRKDFEEVGGFNTEFFYSFEDIELCLKIKDKLKKGAVYCPNSVLVHNEGISKTQPRLQDNIAAFRKNCSGKYYNDLEFYLNNPNFMIYKPIIQQKENHEAEIE